MSGRPGRGVWETGNQRGRTRAGRGRRQDEGERKEEGERSRSRVGLQARWMRDCCRPGELGEKEGVV